MFRGYDDNYLQLDERRITSSLVLHRNEITAPWGPEKLSELTPEHLAAIFSHPPEALLIGTGRRTTFPDPAVMQALDDAHIGYEFMDSRAAARTYNILVEEGRETSVAMLLPGVS